MGIRRTCLLSLILAAAILSRMEALAAPTATFQGRLARPDGSAMTGQHTQLRIQIRSSGAEDCVLWDETQEKNLSGKKGLFTVSLNDGHGVRNDVLNSHSFAQVFTNEKPFVIDGTLCAAGSGTVTFTPAATDERKIAFYFKDEQMSAWESMPYSTLTHSAYALEAARVGGFPATSLLRVENGSGPQTASPLTPANFTELLALINGTSANYVRAGASGTQVSVVAGSPAAPASGTLWFDSSAHAMKFFDGTSTRLISTAGGSVTSVTAGAGLDGGTITSSGTISLSDSGVTAATYGAANKIPVIAVDAKGRVTSVSESAPQVTLSGLKSSVSPYPSLIDMTTTCDAATTLAYNSVSDRLVCTAISVSASQITTGTIANALLPFSAKVWQDGGGGKIYYNGGNVGVGTTAPTGKLQIAGALNVAMEPNAFGTVSPFTAFILGATSGATADNGGLYAIGRKDKSNEPFTALSGWDNGTARTLYFGGGSWAVPDATEIGFYTAPAYSESNNTGVERLHISSNGTVSAAGNLTAGGTFSVGGTSTFGGTVSVNAAHNVNGLVINNSALTSRGWSFFPFTNGTETDLRMFEYGTANGTRVTFQAGGNVGVGTTNPASLLDVNGTGRFGGTAPLNFNDKVYQYVTNFSVGVPQGSYTQFMTINSPANATASLLLQVLSTGYANTTEFYHIPINYDDGTVAIGSTYRVLPLNTTGKRTTVTTGWGSGDFALEWMRLSSTQFAFRIRQVGATDQTVTVPYTIHITSIGNQVAIASSTGTDTSTFTYPLYRQTPLTSGNSRVGINTSSPASALDVNGSVKVGSDASTCSATNQGAIRLNGTAIEYCNATAWTRITSSSSVVGASAGTTGAPSLSFSGDPDTGFSNASSNNTITVSAGGSSIFNFASTGLTSPTTGGASITTANGTASAPTFSFTGDTGTGWWRPAASTMAASTGGTERLRIDSNGNIGIGSTTPTSKLDIGGNVSASSWSTTGPALQTEAATYTDTSSAVSATVGTRVANSFGAPTFASSNAITVTNAVNLYVNAPVAGSNTTMTNPYAIYANGSTYTNGSLTGFAPGPGGHALSGTYGVVKLSTQSETVTGGGLPNSFLQYLPSGYGTTGAAGRNSYNFWLGGGGYGASFPTQTVIGSPALYARARIDSDTFTAASAQTITNAATLYIGSAPANGTNVAITNPYALYVASGNSYFSGNVGIGTANSTTPLTIGSSTTNASNGLNILNTTSANSYQIWAGTPGNYDGYLKFGINPSNQNNFAVAINSGGLFLPSGNSVGLNGTGAISSNDGGGNFKLSFNGGSYTTLDSGTHLTLRSGAAETMRLTAAGNVGIGTTSPAAQLHLSKAGNNYIQIDDTSNTSSVRIFSSGDTSYIGTATGHKFNLRSGGVDAVTLNTNGNVGVGTSTASEKLHVVGNLRVQGSTDCTLGNGAGGTNCSSDARLKENVREIENPLSKILSLRGVEFEWNERSRSPGRHDIGVIAQDVEKVFPTAVVEDPQSGYKKVDYAVLIAPVIQALREINGRLTSLFSSSNDQAREIASLKSKLDDKSREVEELKSYLCAKDPRASICH